MRERVMRVWTLIRDFGHHKKGDRVEMPDDAALSPLTHREEDPETVRAVNDKAERDTATAKALDSAENDSPAPGVPASASPPASPAPPAVAAPATAPVSAEEGK